jgi:cytochrome P450
MHGTHLRPLLIANALFAYTRTRELSGHLFYAIAVSWAVTLSLYLLVWHSWIYPYYYSPLRDIPTVKGCPLWGQFFDIIAEECGVPQRRWHQQYGPVIRYFFPFGSERLSVADEDALRRITVENPYNYPKPVRAKLWMTRILGEGLLLAEGVDHKIQRRALAPAFSTQSIRDLAPVFWEKALLMSKCWRVEMRDANVSTKSIEVLEWLNRATLDIIGKAGFGYDIDSLREPASELREAYRLMFTFDIWSRVFHGVQAFIPSSKHLPVKMNRDMEQSRNIIVNTATGIIREKQAEAKSGGGKDIMALIAKHNVELQDAGERGLSSETMRDQVITFLGAGHDTTATALAWTLHLLSTYPEVQGRLREEISAHFPHLFDLGTRCDITKLADADVDQLPYLDNVCRESLRYIPPIPLTVREALTDDVLAGYYVPAGTTVYVIANAINRLPEYWGDTADQFDPDRWNNLPATWSHHALMTFSHGPRGCIGRKFSETEMKVLLCCLLSMFKFERDESTPDPEADKAWRLVLRPKHGMKLKTTAIETVVAKAVL